MKKPKLFLHCVSADRKAIMISGCPDRGIEFLGDCYGMSLDEQGNKISEHWSSTLDWLRHDLMWKIDKDKYDVVDMIDEDVSKL